ncbi:MAG: hypothetical protein RBS48_05805 [Ignavibacteriaceae bacterium]|jgi:hypothetical protein|nr:hypothetical protein [Ignavibacteriaceae bacterium]
MDENKLKELWQSTNDDLEQIILLNKKNTEDITNIKVQTLLSSMKPLKIFTIVVGILWVGFGSIIIINLFIHSYNYVSPFFLFSASIQLLLTAIALVIYLYQLILINQVDISKPIVETQEKLASLKSSTLWTARVLFLQLPVWTTFYLTEGMFKSGNIFLIIIQIIITLLFSSLAVWLFVNIKYKNRDKKWFKLIFSGKEWTPVIKSMELYKEITEFKKEN